MAVTQILALEIRMASRSVLRDRRRECPGPRHRTQQSRTVTRAALARMPQVWTLPIVGGSLLVMFYGYRPARRRRFRQSRGATTGLGEPRPQRRDCGERTRRAAESRLACSGTGHHGSGDARNGRRGAESPIGIAVGSFAPASGLAVCATRTAISASLEGVFQETRADRSFASCRRYAHRGTCDRRRRRTPSRTAHSGAPSCNRSPLLALNGRLVHTFTRSKLNRSLRRIGSNVPIGFHWMFRTVHIRP